MRKEALDQKIKKILGRENIYSDFFDTNKCIFIHTPKAAGTAISKALYGEDPWHFSAKECRFIDRKRFDDYYKFSVVRHPVSRMISTYNYAFSHTKKHPENPIAFITKYKKFDDFILEWLTEENVKHHYFFWSYRTYLCNRAGHILVDDIIKIESLKQSIQSIEKKLGKSLDIKKINVSEKNSARKITQKTLERIYRVYTDDFELFDYKKTHPED